MAKKRGHNEGSIYRRQNGTWSVQATLQGHRLSCTFKTQRECQEWLKKIRGQIDEGMTLSTTKIVLGDFLSSWLTSTKTSKGRSTWRHYEQLTRTYIVPSLGKIKVRDLRPEHIQAFYNRLFEHQVGVYTIRKIHIILHSALQQAVKTGMIERNPAGFVQPPKEPASEMAILNESQVSQLLIAAQGTRLEALIHLAVISGARQMELLGLKWSDLDWVKQTLKIERQLLKPNGEGVKFSSPKTRHGKRSITLGAKTIEILRKHYEQQQAKQRKAGEMWKEYGLIFTTRFGTPLSPRNLLRDYKKLLHNAGLPPIRFHDLRHTAASILLNQGVPVIAVSRRLGHAKASITLDIYGHLIPTMQTEVAEMIDDLVMPVTVQLDKKVEPEP
jgi:integrase